MKAYFQFEFLNLTDITLLPDLIKVLPGDDPKFYFLVLFFVFLVVLIVCADRKKFDFKKLIVLASLFCFFNVIAKIYFIDSLNKNLKIQQWSSRLSSQRIGPLSYFWLHAVNYEFFLNYPSDEEVHEAYRRIMTKKQSDGQAIPNQALQNIYFFVVESFWDPTTVLGQQKIENPIDTQFRALQEKHGKFHAVVPDFSGGTAHSEFEILCGLPVNIFYPIFKFALNDKLDCLPRVLSKLGYKTMAIHPGHRTMWNRDKTYKKIGFENYFAGDTIIGNSGQNIDAFYRDENFLKYALDFVKHKNSERKKNFFYFLTMGLHYPFYNLGGTKDPKFNSDNPYLSKYLESVAVTTKHLARTIAQIQTLDPEGIIVIAGDHLPHKINPELFSVNGDDLRAFNTSDISNFSTPLVLINLPKPRKNYVRLTELAGLVFRKLKLPPGQYTSDLPMSLPEANYLYDFTFDSVTGAAVDCNRSTTGCDQFYIMKKNYQIIMDDFLFGKQLGLKILENKVLHQ